MSTQIPIAFVQKFHDDVIMLAQQKESRLERTVNGDPDHLVGKLGYFDRIAPTEVNEVTTRHGDTNLVNTQHSRRRIIQRDFDWADLIDRKDMRRFLNAGAMPAKYQRNAVMAMNRKKDTLIIEAASGNAYSMDEDDAATAVALPSAQKIAHGSAGLTLAKLLQAKEIIDGADFDEELPRYAVVSAKQVTNMLNTTEITSSDYATVKALSEGKIDSYLGFDFIRSERLQLDSNSHRLCLFYVEGAIGMAVGQEIEVDIGPRRDKKNSIQVYVDYAGDATRVEDEGVVEVACQES